MLAIVSQARGVALFVRDGMPYRVLADQPRKPEQLAPIEFARELAGIRDGERFEVVDEEALARIIEERRERESLLFATVVLLDSATDAPVRREAAREWQTLWNENAWKWIEGVLLSTTPPPGTDLAGAINLVGEKASHPLREVLRLLPYVSAACQKWELEGAAGSGESSRAQAVRSGWFRDRVRELAEASEQAAARQGQSRVHMASGLDPVRVFACGAVDLDATIAPLVMSARNAAGGSLDEALLHRVFQRSGAQRHSDPEGVLVIDVCTGSPKERTYELGTVFYLGRVSHGRPELVDIAAFAEDRAYVAQVKWHEPRESISRKFAVPMHCYLAAHDFHAWEHKSPEWNWEWKLGFFESPSKMGRTWGLLGPDRDLRCKFTDQRGSVFGFLLYRMLADRLSGVPHHRAGWSVASSIDRTLDLTKGSTLRAVRSMKEEAIRAGMPETLLVERGDQVRVEVDYAAAAK